MSAVPRGRFITFEGVEGSGKSTNVASALTYLRSKGIDVVQTHEPGKTGLGDEIRNVVLRTRNEHDEPVSPMAELFLMFASRCQLLNKDIEPALSAGKWVLCDRYADSSIAYQGGGREIGVDRVKGLITAMGPTYIEPDLTILLDIPSELIHERLIRRDLDRFESEDLGFFDRVRNTYLELEAKTERIRLIRADSPIDVVRRDIESLLDELILSDVHS